MNPIAEEIASYKGSAEMSDKEFIKHYGVPRRSGRYPWGSGGDPYQHGRDFLSRVEELKKNGWKETPETIKRDFNLSVKDFRSEKAIATNQRQVANIRTALRLRDKEGITSPTDIAKAMGMDPKKESTVREWFKQHDAQKVYQLENTVNHLKERVKESRMIDVGKNAERDLGISKEKLRDAVRVLENEGYHRYVGRIPQPTNKNQATTQIVLAAPDVQHKEIFDFSKVKPLKEYITKDNGETFEKRFTYPESLNSKRLKIRYAEDGGIEKDGVVELRRNVKDLDLRGSLYSQVRILVDGTHYIKGMAVYADDKDMPDGVDAIFNTNKTKEKSKLQCLKEIKRDVNGNPDPENPFGSAIKDAELGGQYWYTDSKGKKKLGLINKRADEGDWTEWKDTLPSQFLSKQPKEMAKKQLDLAKANRQAEFDEIMSLNNPTIKKYYLEKFASSCDSAAIDLKAAALPGQKYHVIIPNNTLKDNEVYAPGYEPGTKLALVRYPHGGTFEIPVCTVNNKNQLGKKLIGNTPIDAICINARVASRLSGADFDGDTVMCIPTDDKKGKVKITRSNELQGLKGFDNKAEYGTKESIDSNGKKHYINKYGKEISVMKNTDNEMGKISNLITDMTLQGADEDKLARAVRHSMVVIDAEKHKLDYKQSYIDNNINELKKEYQPRYDANGNKLPTGGGAFTLISKSKGPKNVTKRQGQARPNIKGKSWYDPTKPEGSLLYMDAPDEKLYYAIGSYNSKTRDRSLKTADGKTIIYNLNNGKDRAKYDPVMQRDPKTGEIYFTNKDKTIKYASKKRTDTSTNMAEAYDANDLVSKKRHPMELIYADYANSMKAMANKARVELINTKGIQYNKNAAKVYAKEVSKLEADLNEALKNSAKERQASRLANARIQEKQKNNPNLKGEDLRKLSQKLMSKYRDEVGAIPRRQRNINIDDKEWEAIQAGAISDTKLKEILKNSNPDVLRERAMPKDRKTVSQAQISRIKAMDYSNFTLEEIAKKMNLSKSEISKILKGVN